MHQILLADDDKNLTLALSYRLAHAGYDVLTANNAEEAMEIALEERPDLLMFDVWMPPGYGLDVAERLRALHFEAPIIFLSGLHDPEVQRVADKLGQSRCIDKPYDPIQLMAAVRRATRSIGNEKRT